MHLCVSRPILVLCSSLLSLLRLVSSSSSSSTPTNSSHSCSRDVTLTTRTLKSGQQWSRITLPPPPSNFVKHLFAVLLHMRDDGARRSCLFVPRSPNQQLQQN